jgi:Fe-S-cluster containining protein
MPEGMPSLPSDGEPCTSCGHASSEAHHEDCLLAEHQAMIAGDETAQEVHDPDQCYWCLEQQPPALSSCRCGECCRRLIIEVTLEDAKREPKIKERGSPIFLPAELTESGQRELTGYFLNSADNGHACTFFDRATNLCSIYPTRPLICRLFDCAHEGREQLIELGILERDGAGK